MQEEIVEKVYVSATDMKIILGIKVDFDDNICNKKNVIYLIEFNGTDKLYVGQTSLTLYDRTYGHIYEAVKQNCDNLCSKAIRRYKHLKVSILEYCDTEEELNALEEFYIEKLNTIMPFGYNLQPGGNNHKHSQETIEKLRITTKKLYKNNKYLEQRRQTQSRVTKELWQREEYRAKMSKSRINDWQREDYRNKVLPRLLNARQKCCKQVYQYDFNLNLVAIYKNGPDAALSNGLKYNQSKNIVYAAKQNENKTKDDKLMKCFGFIWSYSELKSFQNAPE